MEAKAIIAFVQGLVRGSTLRYKLKRENPHDLGTMIAIANQWADADDDARGVEDPAIVVAREVGKQNKKRKIIIMMKILLLSWSMLHLAKVAKALKAAKAKEAVKVPASEAVEVAEGRDVILLQEGRVTRSGETCLALTIPRFWDHQPLTPTSTATGLTSSKTAQMPDSKAKQRKPRISQIKKPRSLGTPKKARRHRLKSSHKEKSHTHKRRTLFMSFWGQNL
jgi:hypothetical protein